MAMNCSSLSPNKRWRPTIAHCRLVRDEVTVSSSTARMKATRGCSRAHLDRTSGQLNWDNMPRCLARSSTDPSPFARPLILVLSHFRIERLCVLPLWSLG